METTYHCELFKDNDRSVYTTLDYEDNGMRLLRCKQCLKHFNEHQENEDAVKKVSVTLIKNGERKLCSKCGYSMGVVDMDDIDGNFAGWKWFCDNCDYQESDD